MAKPFTSYFSFELPDIIDEPGKYVTRIGEVVTVLTVNATRTFCDCRGMYSDSVVERWNVTGRLYTGQLSQNDIVRKVKIAVPSMA